MLGRPVFGRGIAADHRGVLTAPLLGVFLALVQVSLDGLQQSIDDVEEVEEELQLESILDRLTLRPHLGVTLEVETDARLPRIVGGLSVALALRPSSSSTPT